MKTLKAIAALSTLGLALIGKPAYAAEKIQLPDLGKNPPLVPVPVPVLTIPPSKSGQPNGPDKTVVSTDVQQLISNFNAARDKFLDEQKQLRKKYDAASKDEREKLRSEIKDKRQQFLDQTKDSQEELRKRLTELKDQLKDHSQIIEDAKGRAKDQIKNRKGGDN